jgi:hypothetical protein
LIIDRALARLDESERRLIWLRFFEQRSSPTSLTSLASARCRYPGCSPGCCSSYAASSACRTNSLPPRRVQPPVRIWATRSRRLRTPVLSKIDFR